MIVVCTIGIMSCLVCSVSFKLHPLLLARSESNSTLSVENLIYSIGDYWPVFCHSCVCGGLSVDKLCNSCTTNPQKVAVVLNSQILSSENSYQELSMVSAVSKDICSCIRYPYSCVLTVWAVKMSIILQVVHLSSVQCCQEDYMLTPSY